MRSSFIDFIKELGKIDNMRGLPRSVSLFLRNEFCNSDKHVLFFYIGEQIETNIHLEEPFYLLTKTWKYGGCVFGPEVAG